MKTIHRTGSDLRRHMSKPLIVIVQDNPADIQLFRLALVEQKEPYQLIELRDGAEALRFVRERHGEAEEPEPCVILLNLYLPKYDGVEVLRALKADARLKHVQVVMLTSAIVPPSERLKMEHLGAIIWQKPKQLAQVIELAAFVLDLCKKAIGVG